MKISNFENVVRLEHIYGTGEYARPMADHVTNLVAELRRRFPKVAMINDGENFHDANQEFLQTWAAWVRAHQNQVVITCFTSKAWVRAVAKTVSVLARVDFEVFKTEAETAAYLRSQSFPDVSSVGWKTTLQLDPPVGA